MSPVSTSEKTGMPLWDLIAKECDIEATDTEPINQKIQETWKRMAKRFGEDGEDVAQEALCQALEKATRGTVEKPLHYAAKSAWRIAKDERKAYSSDIPGSPVTRQVAGGDAARGKRGGRCPLWGVPEDAHGGSHLQVSCERSRGREARERNGSRSKCTPIALPK